MTSSVVESITSIVPGPGGGDPAPRRCRACRGRRSSWCGHGAPSADRVTATLRWPRSVTGPRPSSDGGSAPSSGSAGPTAHCITLPIYVRLLGSPARPARTRARHPGEHGQDPAGTQSRDQGAAPRRRRRALRRPGRRRGVGGRRGRGRRSDLGRRLRPLRQQAGPAARPPRLVEGLGAHRAPGRGGGHRLPRGPAGRGVGQRGRQPDAESGRWALLEHELWLRAARDARGGRRDAGAQRRGPPLQRPPAGRLDGGGRRPARPPRPRNWPCW